MIARGRIAPAQHHIAKQTWIGVDPAAIEIMPVQRPASGESGGDVEAQRIGFALGNARGAFGCAERAAGARIEGTLGPVRRGGRTGDLGGNLLAAAEAGIEKAVGRETIEGGAIIGEMIRLPAHRLLPGKAEPGEVLINPALELRPAAAAVDILDAQQESPPFLPRSMFGKQRRIGVTEMQRGRWGWVRIG